MKKCKKQFIKFLILSLAESFSYSLEFSFFNKLWLSSNNLKRFLITSAKKVSPKSLYSALTNTQLTDKSYVICY